MKVNLSSNLTPMLLPKFHSSVTVQFSPYFYCQKFTSLSLSKFHTKVTAQIETNITGKFHINVTAQFHTNSAA